RSGHVGKTRYTVLGFTDQAALDDAGGLWPTSYAVAELTPQSEEEITEVVQRAAGREARPTGIDRSEDVRSRSGAGRSPTDRRQGGRPPAGAGERLVSSAGPVAGHAWRARGSIPGPGRRGGGRPRRTP